MASGLRSNTGVQWFLELSGRSVGRLQSADFPTANTLVIQFAGGMNKAFLDWIGTSSSRGGNAKGSVVTVNYAGNVVYWDDWSGGRVTKIEMPAMDATSKTSVFVRVTIQFAQVQLTPKPANTKYPTAQSAVQKNLTGCNFKFTADGVDASKYVSSVSGITIGGGGSPLLVAQIVELRAATMRTWQQSRNPKPGSLQYLTPDLKTAVFTLSFKSLTISGIVPVVPVDPTEKITINLQPAGIEFKSS